MREAAKAAVRAADAATAPSPSAAAKFQAGPSQAGPAQARPAQAERSQARPAEAGRGAEGRSRVAARQTAAAARGLKQGGKRFGEAVWGPFAKLSGVLWHEIMGVLFGMFAAVAGMEAWHGRASLRAGAEGRTHELLAIAMLAGFGYFTASSFVKASRRQRT